MISVCSGVEPVSGPMPAKISKHTSCQPKLLFRWSMASIKLRERGKKVILVGNVPLYYVYEHKRVNKGALKSSHLLLDDGVR
jgi:hypothetical protein